MRRLSIVVTVAALVACSAPPKRPPPPPRDLNAGQTRPGCAGRLIAPKGFVRADDPHDVIAQVRRPAGEGGLCHAQRHTLERPVTLHRVYSSKHPDRRLDGAWTLDPPDGTRDQLRRDLGVCESFSALDRLISCELPTGTSVVLGLGQSMVCASDERYPQSAVLQAWVVDADTIARAARCQEGPWPP